MRIHAILFTDKRAYSHPHLHSQWYSFAPPLILMQAMVSSLSEHRGAVNALKINRDGTQCVSASADGSCIVWCLVRWGHCRSWYEVCLSVCLSGCLFFFCNTEHCLVAVQFQRRISAITSSLPLLHYASHFPRTCQIILIHFSSIQFYSNGIESCYSIWH